MKKEWNVLALLALALVSVRATPAAAQAGDGSRGFMTTSADEGVIYNARIMKGRFETNFDRLGYTVTVSLLDQSGGDGPDGGVFEAQIKCLAREAQELMALSQSERTREFHLSVSGRPNDRGVFLDSYGDGVDVVVGYNERSGSCSPVTAREIASVSRGSHGHSWHAGDPQMIDLIDAVFRR